jgi:hypothetical protein
VFFAVQWLAVLIVLAALAIAILPRGTNEVLRIVVLPAGIMLLFILAVVMVFPGMYVPAVIRERELRHLLPSAFVGTVLLNSTDKEAINDLRGVAPFPRRLVMTVGFSADDHGVNLWRGVKTPQIVASLAWRQVDKVEVSSYVFSGRTLGALTFAGTMAGGAITLSLVKRRWFGLSPSRPHELDAVAVQLRTLLEAAHD